MDENPQTNKHSERWDSNDAVYEPDFTFSTQQESLVSGKHVVIAEGTPLLNVTGCSTLKEMYVMCLEYMEAPEVKGNLYLIARELTKNLVIVNRRLKLCTPEELLEFCQIYYSEHIFDTRFMINLTTQAVETLDGSLLKRMPEDFLIYTIYRGFSYPSSTLFLTKFIEKVDYTTMLRLYLVTVSNSKRTYGFYKNNRLFLNELREIIFSTLKDPVETYVTFFEIEQCDVAYKYDLMRKSEDFLNEETNLLTVIQETYPEYEGLPHSWIKELILTNTVLDGKYKVRKNDPDWNMR